MYSRQKSGEPKCTRQYLKIYSYENIIFIHISLKNRLVFLDFHLFFIEMIISEKLLILNVNNISLYIYHTIELYYSHDKSSR